MATREKHMHTTATTTRPVLVMISSPEFYIQSQHDVTAWRRHAGTSERQTGCCGYIASLGVIYKGSLKRREDLRRLGAAGTALNPPG
jgi:hypothetical protein